MERVDESVINEIRNSADIVSIISDYIPLKMQGKNYFGICPFHDDHTPSMSVSKERQIYKCFVCGKSGNVFSFVKDYENISFIEAVKKVADRVGISFNYNTSNVKNEKYKKEYEIMDFATNILQNNLNSSMGSKAKEYLNSRSITDNVIKEFRIGYSLNDNKYLYNVLTKKGYDINILDDLGLITKDGINGYDKFVNRIMIPITNLEGEVVGYTGRIFNGEDSAKYINTKETIIYKKGNIIFNYFNAKNYIRESKSAIVVEGNMDAIRMYSSGIKNVLALMGTAITKEQVNILKKLRVPIILMLDNDKAGEDNTISVGDALTKDNIEVLVVRLSGAKDPDEYIIKYGIDKLKDVINHGINYFDYKLNILKNNKDLNNTEELIKYVKEVIKELDDKDNLTKEITLKKLSDEYNLDYEDLKKEVNFSKEDNKDIIVKPSINIVKKSNKYDICVKNILYYMMCDSKYIKIFNSNLGYLDNHEERYLVREIEHYIEKYGKINIADFISYSETVDNIKEYVKSICEVFKDDELDEKIFLEYIMAIKKIINKREIDRLKIELKNTIDMNKKIEISNKIAKLKKEV